jgi:hypothetical protein
MASSVLRLTAETTALLNDEILHRRLGAQDLRKGLGLHLERRPLKLFFSVEGAARRRAFGSSPPTDYLHSPLCLPPHPPPSHPPSHSTQVSLPLWILKELAAHGFHLPHVPTLSFNLAIRIYPSIQQIRREFSSRNCIHQEALLVMKSFRDIQGNTQSRRSFFW